MYTALTIAGSDSGGGAGIQQDLKTFTSFKVHGATVLTAITAQNTQRVDDYLVLPLDIIQKQIDSVTGDLDIRALKTGMLATAGVIKTVREKIREHSLKNIVVDPVMVATSGDRLLDGDAVREMKKLITDAEISTPNIYEAEILTGIGIKSMADMEKAAEKIGDCVVTGGHMDAIDVLCWDGEIHTLRSRIERKNMKLHGSGCAFSAAIAASLARGRDIPEAVEKAKFYMDNSIEKYFSVGLGSRLIDTGNIKLTESVEDKEKTEVLDNLGEAVETFISEKKTYLLIPQVGSNIAMALPTAKKLGDVAGISGRMIMIDENVTVPGVIRFGGTTHMGRLILTAMEFDKEKRAVINIRYNEGILEACQKLHYRISRFKREDEPDSVKTMEWGIREAVRNTESFPDVVYDIGGKGKEPMVRIIGRDAVEAVNKAVKVAEILK